MYNNPEVLPYDWIKMGGRSGTKIASVHLALGGRRPFVPPFDLMPLWGNLLSQDRAMPEGTPSK